MKQLIFLLLFTSAIFAQKNNGTITQTAHSTGVRDGTNNLQFGRLSTGNYFDGILDEVAIWKRVLTPEERTYLYNNGTGRTYTGGKIQ